MLLLSTNMWWLIILPGGWKRLLNISRSQARPTPGCIFFTTFHQKTLLLCSRLLPGTFSGPSQGPKKASKRPLSGLRPWRRLLCTPGNNIRCTLAATDAADQGFSLKAKSHQAFGESLLLAGQFSLWQISHVLNSNYGPMCVWSFKNSCWHGTVRNCACVIRW